MSVVGVLLVGGAGLAGGVEAFAPGLSSSKHQHHYHHLDRTTCGVAPCVTPLLATYDDNDPSPENSSSSSSSTTNNHNNPMTLRRLGLTGVSVSDQGFQVLWGLRTAPSNNDDTAPQSPQPPPQNEEPSLHYWPWAVTTPQAGDTSAVTSAQALTLCQLIAGIDLAGSRLPADILAQVTVLSCEQQQQDNGVFTLDEALVVDQFVGDLQQQLQRIQNKWFPPDAASTDQEPLTYTDAPAWIRARVRLPVCTLDQIVVTESSSSSSAHKFRVSFHVQVRDYGSLVLTHVTDAVLADVLAPPTYDDYTFSDDTRRAFLTTALSLRYKAPVLYEQAAAPQSSPPPSHLITDIPQAFPLYTTVQKVQTPSDRVVSRIEKGWEIHQLQAAYQIARQKQDLPAVAKIRAKLDEMDAMPDLPVQADSELDSMQ